MISKYGIFCKVIENSSFTKTAALCGYSQSAVSQSVRSLEQELEVTLIERRKDGMALTPDGERFFPYIKEIAVCESALWQKKNETLSLKNSEIRVGTFTSVSRRLLPPVIKDFKRLYPDVRLILRQGEYTGIAQWIASGSVDFGFVHMESAKGLWLEPLYEDEMAAVLPKGHPLASRTQVTLAELSDYPLILLDEGEFSVARQAFSDAGAAPDIEYEVYDDYSILSMVRQGLGVSVMYSRVLDGFDSGLDIRPIINAPRRTVALAWKNRATMPYAARKFADFIISAQQNAHQYS